MKFRDARTIPPEQLYERRKQAIALRKKGISFIEISKIVGVRRDVVGRWYAMWQDGGMKALKVSQAGAPKGSGLRLNTFEQEPIRKNLIEKSPDQLKMPFALWTRDAVRDLEAQTLQATEESMIDSAQLLANFVENGQDLDKVFQGLEDREFEARIYAVLKNKVGINAYLTDQNGIVS